MPDFKYSPDKDLQVHKEGAIKLIHKSFQSHEDGLPEWVKNASDAYARIDASHERRVIVVILASATRTIAPSISCLDFGGMSASAIEENFRVWADPEAATRGARGSATAAIAGGHGSGGKCYMTQMFEEYAYLHTVKDGLGCRYGVPGGQIMFGYMPDRTSGRSFPVKNLEDEARKSLGPTRCRIDALPVAARKALRTADGFTLFRGVGPRGYDGKIPTRELVESLREHPHLAQVLEFCFVYVVVDGEVANAGRPLSLPSIVPMEGEEKPRVIPIPAHLKDPASEQRVATTSADQPDPGVLTLWTSQVSMRRSMKGRHVITFKATSGFVGFAPVIELDVESPYRDRIYGECRLDGLERYKQNDRRALAPAPLTRALLAFVSRDVESYAREFEARDRRSYNQKEKDAVSQINEALDRWKNRFLTEVMAGLWGAGEDAGVVDRQSLPIGTPKRIEVSLSHQKAGLGVAFRPRIRFLDKEGKQICPTPYRWVSYDNNVAVVDDSLMIVTTYAYGKTEIYAQTLDGKLESNRTPLEVVRLIAIQLSPSEVQVAAGSRTRLEANCTLPDGSTTNDVYLVWTEDNPQVARVSAAGLVYGFGQGETAVVAGDDKCISQQAKVTVVEGDGKGPGKNKGKGYPRVFVSGQIDRDPYSDAYVNFASDEPPVCQRPEDATRNIWWINSASPLARLYLDTSKGYGYKTREWRMYMLERYVDVIVQVVLTHGPDEMRSMSVDDWIREWGAQAAAIQAAAVDDLAVFIKAGDLPE